MTDKGFRFPKFVSTKSSDRLRIVASLRARGIGDHVDLPQLVVGGDQSAGKSSVLEGISGLPFPRQDGVCTKFPTEIIIEHSDGPFVIVASILPSKNRDEATKAQLVGYNRVLERFEELPEVITDVGTLMGIRGFGHVLEGPAFAEDVLRINVSGPTGLHLTIVDLPGLISVHGEDQTEEDTKTVHEMVDSYAANPRTIILAVVQAGNDIANQSIIQKSRQFDQAGQRTVGVITKPDLINEGTEKRISALAKNEDTTKLKLGFFLLKNPTPTEMAKGITAKERQNNEKRFFQSSPWKEQGLSADRVGILALATFLQNLLDSHIERELPKVREEIKSLMKQTEQQMLEMGGERSTIGDMRIFLTRLSMRFRDLVIAGLHGSYDGVDSGFFDNHEGTEFNSLRLRALIHRLNTQFSDYIRENGEKRKLSSTNPSSGFGEVGQNDQILVGPDEMHVWVKTIYENSRGRELPGTRNDVLLSELFHIQSSRWYQIARNHADNVFDQTVSFVKSALRKVTNDDKLFDEVEGIIDASLATARGAANEELRELWHDEQQQPITYNHYYTDNIQNSRSDASKSRIRKAIDVASEEDFSGKKRIPRISIDVEELATALQSRVIVNMDEQACVEAQVELQAYYKVARKTFVDNVCKQVIERHLLRNLPSIFCPESVAALSDEDLTRIAAERPENIEKRKMLRALVEGLESSLQDLRK